MNTRKTNLVNDFLSSTSEGQRYVLGRNAHAEALINTLEIDGIVDDYSHEHSWHGKPLFKGEQLPQDAIVVNCSMSISPNSAMARLKKLAIKGCINYADLYQQSPQTIPPPDFVAEMQSDYKVNKNKWFALMELLTDDASKKILADIIHYRLSADPSYMTAYSTRFSDQYFEDFLNLKQEVFVDAGGFTGDTTEEFCKRYPDYKKVFLFEPSAKNMHDAKSRLKNHRDIHFVELGISDTAGTLWFNPDAGSASAVCLDGSASIEVCTLDKAITEKVSLIKMDLEGWEMKALQGAKQHIINDHPKLAISVYHKAADFWQIPEYILSLRQDYQLYLRHYTEGWSETVMFFVPNKID